MFIHALIPNVLKVIKRDCMLFIKGRPQFSSFSYDFRMLVHLKYFVEDLVVLQLLDKVFRLQLMNGIFWLTDRFPYLFELTNRFEFSFQWINVKEHGCTLYLYFSKPLEFSEIKPILECQLQIVFKNYIDLLLDLGIFEVSCFQLVKVVFQY